MAKSDIEAKVRLVVDSKTYNAALRQANKEAKEFRKQQQDSFKGVGDGISKAFGGAVGVIGKFAPVLSGSAAAMAVAKKAMEENQTLTDIWARTTESAKATWEGFVDALVRADFSSYFSNMDGIIRRAAEAADAIDRLDTTKIFTSRAMSEYDLAIRKARIVIKDPNSTDEQRKEAGQIIQDTQAKKLADAQRLSDDYMRAFAAKLAEYVNTKGFAASEGDFVEQGADGRWQIRKGSLFDKYYGDLSTYEEAAARYARENQLRSTVVGSVSMGQWGSQAIYGKGDMSDAEFEELRAFVELSDAKLKELFELFAASNREQARVYTEMTENFEYLNRANGATGGVGGGNKLTAAPRAGSIAYVEEQIKAATEAWKNAITQGERDAAEARRKVLEQELADLKAGRIGTLNVVGGSAGEMADIYKGGNLTAPTWRAEQVEIKGKGFGKVVNNTMQYVSSLTDVIGQLGIASMFSTGKVDKTAQIIGRMLSVFGSAVGGPFGSIVGGIGSLFAGGFATGGIVGGTSYKGDQLTAQVSSGEMILNKAQQRNLLALAGGGGAPSVTAVEVRGDKMVLLINNTLRAQGKSTIG